MRPMLARPMFLLATATAALSLAAGPAGCGHTACLQFSQAEYSVNGNSCPAQATALASFTTETCPGPVVSVDGLGSFDGELCCYPVSQDDIVPDCGNGGGGAGGGVIPPGGTGGFEEGTGGSQEGTGGAGVGCDGSCDSVLLTGVGTCSATGESNQDLSDLLKCIKASCSVPCESFTTGMSLAGSCATCSANACESQLASCENN